MAKKKKRVYLDKTDFDRTVDAAVLLIGLFTAVFIAILTFINIIYAEIILDKIMICNIEVEGEMGFGGLGEFDKVVFKDANMAGRMVIDMPCSEIVKIMENQR